MTRTAVRHALSALAAVALISAFTGGPASAVSQTSQMMSNIYKADSDAKLAKPKTPKGLATSPQPSGNGTRNLGQYFRNSHGYLD